MYMERMTNKIQSTTLMTHISIPNLDLDFIPTSLINNYRTGLCAKILLCNITILVNRLGSVFLVH